MVKEMSTVSKQRPTILEEKRRIERELGLPVEPAIVFPKSNAGPAKPPIWRRIVAWVRG